MGIQDMRDGKIGFSPGTFIFWLGVGVLTFSYPFAAETNKQLEALSTVMFIPVAGWQKF